MTWGHVGADGVLAGLLAARLFSYRWGCWWRRRNTSRIRCNPKDLPFATVATACLLAMTWVARTPTFINLRTGVLVVVLGAGLNVRAGALLFVRYLAVLVGYCASAGQQLTERTLAPAGPRIAAIVAGAFAIGWVGGRGPTRTR